MFRIKICGVTSVKDAQFVALAGADAVGLNFHPPSRRFISLESAQAIAKALPARIARVGVFVNLAAAEIAGIADQLKLDWIQLHGDEPASHLASLRGRAIVQAFRFDDSLLARIQAYMRACSELQVRPDAVLIDAAHAGEYGGTGQTLDWSQLAQVRGQLPDLPLVLAGGLTPFNVAEAIESVRPAAVDVASGVETKPGTKDLLLLRAFVTAAKKSFAAFDSA